MSPRIMKVLSFLVISLLLVAGNSVAKNKDGDAKKVKGTENIMGSPSRTHFNINNISTWVYNDGKADIIDGASGFIYPKGSNKAAIYQSGFVWGATLNGEKRVGGSTYGTGLVPGRIIGEGASAVKEDQTLEHVRMYRVRRDYANPDADFSAEINDGEGTKEEIIAQYKLDWDKWPAIYGAPYEDVDGDGSYNPTKDIPGVVGADQTIWFVANDLDVNQCNSLYGSDPMGVELQTTYWGYNQTNALGNMMFRKFKLINKSVDTFDSMYVSMWADPDLGDASDDYSGCDVDLSLMFTYNGKAYDATYGNIPPSVGFDFFQGPIVPAPGETAIVDGKVKKDFKNLPMSTHYFFINGDDVYTDPDLGSYEEGTLWFHNLFEGKITSTGAPFTDPTTGEVTRFTLSGDPITGTGWVDGILHQPGDRRQGMVAGPFNMAAGDTQEVVVAAMVAGYFEGVDRLGSVQLLKFYDLVAQNTYDNFFKVPAPVTQPVVEVASLDQGVLFEWDEGSEDYMSNGYEFQGYVIYQLPSKSASFQDALEVATFDLNDGIGKVFGPDFDVNSGSVLVKLLKSGSDSGLKRHIEVTKDLFKSGAKLNNGTPYYFAVTSYAVNPNDLSVVPTVLESAPIVYEVIPENNTPGWTFDGSVDEPVEVEHAKGSSDGIVVVNVVNPKNLTGLKYSVTFHIDEDTASTTYGNTLWNLSNEQGTVLSNQSFFKGDTKGKVLPPVVDGFSIVVKGPPAGIADWGYKGPRWMSGVNWGGSWFFGGLDMGFNFFGSTITEGTAFMDVQLQWAGATDRTDMSATGLAAASKTENPDRWSKGASYYRSSGYGHAGVADIPFAAYDMESNPPRRLNVCIVEDANDGSANLLNDMGWDGSAFAALGGREYTFIMNSDYNEGADYNDANFGPSSDVLYAIWPKNRGSAEYLKGEFTLDIKATNVIAPTEVYEFTVPNAGYNEDQAKVDIEKINVFPNPYYGVNPNEINKYQRYVTFNHLPPKATIRVFNLAGQLVRTVEKDDNTQFARWTLTNENELPVASGIYIVYVDMPDLGETKVLKVAVIQETQILDRY